MTVMDEELAVLEGVLEQETITVANVNIQNALTVYASLILTQ